MGAEHLNNKTMTMDSARVVFEYYHLPAIWLGGGVYALWKGGGVG